MAPPRHADADLDQLKRLMQPRGRTLKAHAIKKSKGQLGANGPASMRKFRSVSLATDSCANMLELDLQKPEDPASFHWIGRINWTW